MLTHNEFKEKVDRLRDCLTYPELDDLHAIEDYACDLELIVEKRRVELNHICCVCQSSLDGKPLNPELQTSHGYCNVCLEVELSKIGGHNENH